MIIQSTRFGELEVAADQLINFPHGIPGFPDEQSFAYMPQDATSPFSFIQSTTEANLFFLLADPFAFFKDYEFILDDEVAKELDLSPKNPPQVLLIATVKGNLADMTVNLLAPLVINEANRMGRQIILDNREYSTCDKLFPDGLPTATAQGGE